MNPELTMESLGPLHGPAGPEQELMGSPSPHHHPPGRSAGPLRVHPPPAPSMASLLDGAGDYRPELSIPLHHAMSMPCDSSPPGLGMASTYTTLTPLQPLPPISTVSDKFHHPHAHHHHHHHPHAHHPHAHHPHQHQRLSGNVSGSFTLMRDERGLPAMNNLYGPYKEMAGMGQSLSPLGNGLGSLHNPQQGLHNYGPSVPEKMLSPNFEAHPAMLTRSDQHLSRGLATPPAPMMAHLNGMHHHPGGHPQPHGPVLASSRERPPSSSSGQVSNSGQLEEINTKEVAQRITAELKRYSIPQAIFAQRVLCRSQGTLSDLLRNPKPWSKLKSGRETFRRMWKWLQEPEFQRMSALRLAGKWLAWGAARKEPPPMSRGGSGGEGRLVFTCVERLSHQINASEEGLCGEGREGGRNEGCFLQNRLDRFEAKRTRTITCVGGKPIFVLLMCAELFASTL
uniref:One cut homeobox 2 n=1 Tax=Pseudonaja textilis TaxID=8673 RepID=A0A670ZJD3_PSETE